MSDINLLPRKFSRNVPSVTVYENCSSRINWLKKEERGGIRKGQNYIILKLYSCESALLICSLGDILYIYLSHIDWLKYTVTRRHQKRGKLNVQFQMRSHLNPPGKFQQNSTGMFLCFFQMCSKI